MPNRISKKEVISFLSSKEKWLTKTLAEQIEIVNQRIDYSDSPTVPFMGQTLELKILQDHKSFWRFEGQKLTIGCPLVENSSKNKSVVHEVLADFYKCQAKYWLHNKTISLAEDMKLENNLTGIRFRRTKTKWGHCTIEGCIQYNWLIMMAPLEVINYLVAHEVSHLKHMNHSESFWAFVSNIHPTFRENKKWLSDNGHTLRL